MAGNTMSAPRRLRHADPAHLAFTAPYFHDGRAPGLAEVIAHLDQTFGLGLSHADSADLVAYLDAVGDAETPFERKDFAFDMAEVEVFAGLLDQTLADRRADLTRLIVDTVNADLREIAEHWYRPGDRDIRSVIAAWAMQLRRAGTLAREGAWAAAQTAFAAYRNSMGGRSTEGRRGGTALHLPAGCADRLSSGAAACGGSGKQVIPMELY
jgi:hypothetical protein